LNSVYTRVKQIVDTARTLFSRSATGGAINDFVSNIFKDYSQRLLFKINRTLLNEGIPGEKVEAYLMSLDPTKVTRLKQLTTVCPVFHSLRTNYVTFTDDGADFLPDDIQNFTKAYQAPTIRTQTATPPAAFPIRPESTSTIERKLDDPMNAEVDIVSPVGGDIAEEVPEIDNATLTAYLRNNYVTVPEGYNFFSGGKSASDIAEELVAETNTDSWSEIIGILSVPAPGSVTPERRPTPHDGSSGQTASASVARRIPDTLPFNASMAIDESSGSGSELVTELPDTLGGRRLRFTIRRRSETRQTKKNRVRKPRMIDVRV
jgi:hypothetical protein